MRILSIDFGEKRIGLAISDALGFTAQGLPTLENKGKNKSLQKIGELCKEREVKTIIIGIPVNMDGSHGPKAQEILNIIPKLEKVSGLPVKTWDERLTSKQADRLMIEQGLSREKRRADSDRIAATLILQNYLESMRK